LGIATSSLHFVAADFRADDVAQGLRAAGCDPAETTLVLCEGVAAYLDPPVLRGLLHSLRVAVAPGSQLAISVSVTDPSPGFAGRREAFQSRVAALGEPAAVVLEADEADHVLMATGWRCVVGDARLRRVGFLSAVAV
jgi:O-methyltransferase involved in polyketide biosynthesis